VTVLFALVVVLEILAVLSLLLTETNFATGKAKELKRMIFGWPFYVLNAIVMWMNLRLDERKGNLFGRRHIGPQWPISSSQE